MSEREPPDPLARLGERIDKARAQNVRTQPAVGDRSAMQQGLGIDTHLIQPDDISTIEPRLRTDDIALACWEPTAGYADPVATVSRAPSRATIAPTMP